MEATSQISASRPPQSSFLILPRELRDMVYTLLVSAAIAPVSPNLPSSPPFYLDASSQSEASKIDLHITTNKATHLNLRLPSYLLYASRQINYEINEKIYSHIRYMQLDGDFLTGLSPTASTFDILARRPWLTKSVRTVTLSLRLDHVLPAPGGVAVHSSILVKNPWLAARLRKVGLKVREFDLGERGVLWRPQGSWQLSQLCEDMIRWCLDSWLGLSAEDGQLDTLPDLALLLDTFPSLQKIDIGSDHQHLLPMFFSPRHMATCFETLIQRGVEVNILVKRRQADDFHVMLRQNGLEKKMVRLGKRSNDRERTFVYQSHPPHLGFGVTGYRLWGGKMPDVEDQGGPLTWAWLWEAHGPWEAKTA